MDMMYGKESPTLLIYPARQQHLTLQQPCLKGNAVRTQNVNITVHIIWSRKLLEKKVLKMKRNTKNASKKLLLHKLTDSWAQIKSEVCQKTTG